MAYEFASVLSLPVELGKENPVDERARLTSKGQVTIPKRVRDALDLQTGDEVVFRVEPGRAIVAKTEDFLELAGTVAIPSGVRGTPWDEIVRRTRAQRAKVRR